jgi:hypothetical protein
VVHRGCRIDAQLAAVPWQHPLKGELQQSLQRAKLLGPGIPAHRSGGAQTGAILGTPEVISGKQKGISVQKRRTSTGMARDRDHPQVRCEWDDIAAVKGHFDIRGVAGNVGSVQQSLASEALAKGAVVCDIIPMSQKHPPDSP